MEDQQHMEIFADRVASFSCPKCTRRISVEEEQPFASIVCPGCGSTLAVPVQLGSFLLLRLLGRGGMGAVYEALDQSLDRRVAIKVLRREYGEEAKFLQAFLREAQAAAALNHPNVAQIHSFGQEKGQPYIVMELVPGGRLEDLVEAGTVIEEAEVMDIAVHVAEGMKAAHQAGLVHGDIKPANILFDRDGTAKIVDFGLASFVRKKRETPGGTWGTPYYIAPEKVLQKPSDHRADIYSLGATLFHVLTRTAPFEAETAREVVHARLERPPPDPREYRPGVTDETAFVILRMLALKPGRRYPTYTSLLSDLRAAGRAARAAKAEAERQRHETEAEAAARAPLSPTRILMRVALLAGIVGAGVFWVLRRPESPAERAIAYHVLRDGKAVPVYEDEVTDAPLRAVSGEPAALEPIWGRDAGMVAAIADFEDGRAFEAQQKLVGRLATLEPEDPLRYRIALVQFLIEWSGGRPVQADAALALIRGHESTESDDPDGSPRGPDPAVLAYVHYLDGTTDDDRLAAEARHWTGPEASIEPLVRGIRNLSRDDLAAARAAFEVYVVSAPDPSSWVDAFRPTALQWIADIQTWQASSGQWSGRTSRQAVRALENLRDAMSEVFRNRIEAELARIEADREKRSARKEAAKPGRTEPDP